MQQHHALYEKPEHVPAIGRSATIRLLETPDYAVLLYQNGESYRKVVGSYAAVTQTINDWLDHAILPKIDY